MIYKSLTTREMYASIPEPSFIFEMMSAGIKQGSTQLAVSAMEELMRRGAYDEKIGKDLGEFFKSGDLKVGTSMFSMIVSSILESKNDTIAVGLGEAMFKDKLDQMLYGNENEVKFTKGKRPVKPSYKNLFSGKLVDDNGTPVRPSDREKD